jgi:hypothetical protein
MHGDANLAAAAAALAAEGTPVGLAGGRPAALARASASQHQSRLTGDGAGRPVRRGSKRPQQQRDADDADDDSDAAGGRQQQPKRAALGAGPSRFAAGTSGASVPGGSEAGGGPAAGAGAGASASEEPVSMEDGMRRVGLPGHVKSVELINFMNHAHMTMDFGPHVTFISGKNGSGKSATLHALQCCLGVKASKMGRASSLKHLIRYGASEAVVRVTLWNRPYQGHDAFQHDLYGDAVTVERRIGATSTAWALKGADGRVRGRRREDLDALLAALSLNAANPITVMTQETAKNFLAGSTGKADQQKYELYMEATQLGAVAEALVTSRAQIAQMDESVNKVGGGARGGGTGLRSRPRACAAMIPQPPSALLTPSLLPPHPLSLALVQLREEADTLKARRDGLDRAVQSMRGLEAARQEAIDVDWALVWAMVDECEAQVAAVEAQLAGAGPAAAAAARAEAEEAGREVDTLKAATDSRSAFLESFTASAERLEGEAAAARAALNAARRGVRLLESRVRKLESQAAAAVTERHSLERAALEVQAGDDAAATQAVVAQYNRAVGEAQAAQTATSEEVARLTAEHQAASKAAGEADDAARRAADEEAAAAHEAAAAEARRAAAAAAARGGARNALAKFGVRPDGGDMVSAVAAIDAAVAARHFHSPPLGPVGRHLELSEARWSKAVDSAVGSSLSTFLVANREDAARLAPILARFFPAPASRPRVCLMRLDLPRHTVPASQQPRAGVPTVLRVLSCRDPEVEAPVMNYLVDQARAEKAALGEHAVACRALARERNVNNAYAADDGSKHFVRGHSEMSEPMPAWARSRPPRLGTSPKEDASHLEEAAARAAEAVQAARQRLAAARQAAAAAGEAARAARQRLAASKSRGARATQAVAQLLTQVPPEVAATQAAAAGGEGEDASGGDALQAGIVAATQAEADFLGQAAGERAGAVAAAQAEAEADAALRAKQRELEELRDRNTEFVDEFGRETEALAAARLRLAAAQARSAAVEEDQAAREAGAQVHRAKRALMATAAEEQCSRAEADAARARCEGRARAKAGVTDAQVAQLLTVPLLSQKAERMRRRIAEVERSAGAPLLTLEAELKAADKEAAGRGRQRAEAIDLHSKLRASYRRRKAKLEEVDAAVEEHVNRRFNHYMRRKGHLGRLKLDRAAHSLSLSVQVAERRGGTGGGAVKDLKQLSGGERSFTTVAFTLALGAETYMPFRAMDEFDVFMGARRRRRRRRGAGLVRALVSCLGR